MDKEKNHYRLPFDRCLTTSITALGIPQGVLIVLVAFSSIGFIAYRSVTIPISCLVIYFIVLIAFRFDAHFASIFEKYMRLSDVYHPYDEKEEGLPWNDILTWEKPIGNFRDCSIIEGKNGSLQTTFIIQNMVDS